MHNLKQLGRIRWAVRGVLALGVAASVAANVLHANPHPISQTIAAWPPLALLLTIELISRVPVHRWYLALVRIVATVAISGIAAWVSYWHQVGIVARYGETGVTPYLIPLSVDGLVAVASVCLVELAGRIRTATPLAGPTTAPVPPMPPVAHVPVQTGPTLAPVRPAPQAVPTRRSGPMPRRDALSPLTGEPMPALNRVGIAA